jgi:hypothetical protein
LELTPESVTLVERKNKVEKAIKKRKKEANKVSVITFTVTDVGEFIRTGPINLF